MILSESQIKKTIENISKRYKIVEFGPTHHGDCHIYMSPEVYGHSPCSCGLLHDLRVLDYPELVYGKYNEDFARDYLVYEHTDEGYKPPRKPQPIDLCDEKLINIYQDLLEESQNVENRLEAFKEDCIREESFIVTKRLVGEILGSEIMERNYEAFISEKW